MNNFRKSVLSAGIFALIYTVCMYHNSASITFPVLMAAGIWLLYSLKEQRRIFDDRLSTFYVINIMLIAISVFLTADDKLIFMSKAVVLLLYLCLAIELYYNDEKWNDAQYIRKCLEFIIISFWRGFDVFVDRRAYKKELKESGELGMTAGGQESKIMRRQNMKKVGK